MRRKSIVENCDGAEFLIWWMAGVQHMQHTENLLSKFISRWMNWTCVCTFQFWYQANFGFGSVRFWLRIWLSPTAPPTGAALVNEKFTRVILFALSKCDDATKHTHVCVCMRNDRQRPSLLASSKARVCIECEHCRSHLFILIINYVIYRANRVEMVAFTFILAYHLSRHCCCGCCHRRCRRYCRSDNGIHKCAFNTCEWNKALYAYAFYSLYHVSR